MSAIRRVFGILVGGLFGMVLHGQAMALPQNWGDVGKRIDDARAQMLVNPELALSRANAAASLAIQRLSGRDRALAIAEAEAVACQAQIRLGNLQQAASLAEGALARSRRFAPPARLMGDLLLSAGQIATRRDDVQSALRNFQRAYGLFRTAGEKRWQAISLQSIAQLYIRADDAKTALKYYMQSQSEYTAADSRFSLANHNNLGNVYFKLSKPFEAEREFQTALQESTRLGGTKYDSLILRNIARSQIDQGKLASASQSVEKAFLAVDSNETANTWALWNLRAQIAYLNKDLLRAGKAIERALRAANSEADPDAYFDVHLNAYKIFRALQRDDLALYHLEEVKRIDETNIKLTASTTAALMAARFDFANQDLKISQLKAAQLEKSVAFERARATLQRNLLIVIVSASMIVGSLLIVGLILITRSRNRERAAKLVLADTNRELEKAIAAKMEFLATTSHEIRTPLNGILGMTQVMLSDRKLDGALRDRITVVHSAGENMRTLVDDILDVAKMETGKLTVGKGTIELKSTLRQVAQVWRLQAEAAGIALILHLDDCPDRIEGDGGRLRQIVFNLLSNAMKFTEKGTVELIARTEQDRLRIAVRDSGIGIAREWHESIFELFQQVDGGTTRQYGGTGLGLAICRNLAQAMDGDVRVESEPGFGSTFTLDLPLLIADIAPLQTSLDRQSAVLVIERNPLTRGMLRAVLSDRFGAINFAASDDEAADLLAHGEIGWIVADTASVDSWAVIGSDVPTVIIEGTVPVPLPLPANVRAVLAKPISKSTLLSALGQSTDCVAEAA